jgi:hypothetical protein
MMKCCLYAMVTLLIAATPAFAQTVAPTLVPPIFHAPRLMAPRRPPLVRKPNPHAAAAPKKAVGAGNWVRLNTHLLGTVGESTWVNLAQATNIRFYQTGKTPFAAVGTGGSNYISTSDPVEIQKLKAYVLTHQTR